MSYREEVLRTCNATLTREECLTNASLGLAGESGEVADLIKKHVFHKHPLDRDKLIKEIGDIRWYLELMSHLAGVSMEEVERINIEKLRKRYPSGFSPEDSKNRVV